jgi:hypothetical protein
MSSNQPRGCLSILLLSMPIRSTPPPRPWTTCVTTLSGKAAIDKLGLPIASDQVVAAIKVEQQSDTQFTIRWRDMDPKRALDAVQVLAQFTVKDTSNLD